VVEESKETGAQTCDVLAAVRITSVLQRSTTSRSNVSESGGGVLIWAMSTNANSLPIGAWRPQSLAYGSYPWLRTGYENACRTQIRIW